MGKRSSNKKDPRHLAREWALGMLYSLEFGRRDPAFLFLHFPELIDAAHQNQDAFELAKTYINEMSARDREIDVLIQNSSPRWKVGRMAYIDRNILRLATYELLHRKVPSRVVINEAVELAKRFGAEQTRNFVNGILQQICTDNAISL